MMSRQIKLVWLKRLRYLSWLLVFGLPVYWAVRYNGLYRWFSEIQVAVFGGYMGLVSWVLPFLILSIPGIYLSGRIDALSTQGMSPEQVNAYFKKTYIGDLERSTALHHRIKRNGLLIVAITMMIGAAGVGSYYLALASFAGPLTVVDLGILRANQAPPSRYIETSGYVDLPRTVTVTSKSRRSVELKYFYIPLTSQDRPAPEFPLQVILEVGGKWRYDEIRRQSLNGRPITVKGVLTTGVDHIVLNGLHGRGVIVSESAWILKDRESPEDYRNMALAILLVLGGLGATGVCGILLTRRWKARRSSSNP